MMSETLEFVATEVDQRQLAEQLLAQAKEQGVELVGPNGLLNQLTRTCWRPRWMRRWPSTWAMTNTTPLGAGRAIPAMALGLRQCSPRSARSRCRGTPM